VRLTRRINPSNDAADQSAVIAAGAWRYRDAGGGATMPGRLIDGL